MKIGIATDLHLGLRQYGLVEREQDFYEQYKTMIKFFIQQKVDTVIIGGDIFDQPRPSPKALTVFTKGLMELLRNDIQVCNVVGNHAMIQDSSFVTADDFIFNVHRNAVLLDWGEECCTISDNGVTIYGLPYHFNYDLKALCDKIYEMNKAAAQDDIAILVLHQSFKEFCGFTGEELSITDIDVSNFDLIICGHIHERLLTQLHNKHTIFLQPGSLERSTIAEARDEETNGKGVYIIDTDDFSIMSIAEGFCRLPCNRPFLISDMYINDISDIDDMKTEIRTECVKYTVPPVLFLTVHDTSNSFVQINDLVKDLKKEFLTVRLNYFDETQTQEELMMDAQDIPSVRGILKIALNPLDEDQAQLGLDLYDMLKDGKDVTELLNDFYQKKYNNTENKAIEMDEFEDFETWWNS